LLNKPEIKKKNIAAAIL